MTVTTAEPVRVLIVDDSAVVRGIIRRMLGDEPDMQVVASAENGRVAISSLRMHPADVVLLDIEMPVLDGLAALPQLLEARPGVRIIMTSTLTTRGAAITLEALARGASDYVAKPSGVDGRARLDAMRPELIAKIRALGRRGPAPAPHAPPAGPVARSRGSLVVPRILAIGSSTGGPQALTAVLSALPATMQLPILVTQHMPPSFTPILAQHLGKDSGRPSEEGRDGMPVRAGRLYVAPGDYHMTVEGSADAPTIRVNQNPPENFCRPAVDPLFRSLAKLYGAATLAVVLTGMGEDGRRGSAAIVEAGGTVLAQDEASSVVWGMPGAVVHAGLAAAVLPLSRIAEHVARLTKAR